MCVPPSGTRNIHDVHHGVTNCLFQQRRRHYNPSHFKEAVMRLLTLVFTWLRRLPALFSAFFAFFMMIYLITLTRVFNLSDITIFSRYLWNLAFPVVVFDLFPIVRV